ncbi:pantothenate kinase [Altericista sp. CCNU0014]|uniref:pantothenate kinase n=1 Tax=Altericista sp. CCNU0014 TaxID=3082949 RepID=UPI00384F519C
MPATFCPDSESWIALAVGNSRLHWAVFLGDRLCQSGRALPPDPQVFLDALPQTWSDWQFLCPFFQQSHPYPELWVASVVPRQTQLWQHYPQATVLERSDVSLPGMYPTLGLDRAIALWSAGKTYGWPVLVIDGGTALTLTGADAAGVFAGGSISPGLGLQLRSLQQGTAGLPLAALPDRLPALWARETDAALQSGTVYGAIAGLIFRIERWWSAYPDTQIILTGGDADVLTAYLQGWHQSVAPLEWLHRLTTEPHAILLGIATLRSQKYAMPCSESKINP